MATVMPVSGPFIPKATRQIKLWTYNLGHLSPLISDGSRLLSVTSLHVLQMMGIPPSVGNQWYATKTIKMIEIFRLIRYMMVVWQNKLFYMLGDLNIDLLKFEEHRLTSSFLDMLYSNNVFPLITKPTSVTQTTATLIDHVLTNNFRYIMYWYIRPLCCISYCW